MRGADLLAQAFDLAPQLVGRSVLFLGDYDGMAPLLLLLEDAGLLIAPKYLTVLDFDHRVLAYHEKPVSVTPQVQRLRVRPYNVLHPVPSEWRGISRCFTPTLPTAQATEVRVFWHFCAEVWTWWDLLVRAILSILSSRRVPGRRTRFTTSTLPWDFPDGPLPWIRFLLEDTISMTTPILLQ